MDALSDETTEDVLSSSIRRSARKKFQPTHYGHDSPGLSSPLLDKKSGSQESGETSEYKASDDGAEKSPGSESYDSGDSDDGVVSPVKGKKRRGKTLKSQPVAKKAKPTRRKSKLSFKGGIASSMFDIIYGGKAALQTVVDDWIKSYNEDGTSAMVNLIRFIIQSCGCKGIVTEDMLEEEENVNAIRKLTEEFDEESDVYPLSGPNGRRFKTNFSEFIEYIIERCQYSIVYDGFMLDKLVTWIISLSDSQVRAFRHTSTLAGMKLVAALIHVALNVNVELDNTQRQLDSENQKAAAKRGVQKMEKLQDKKRQLRDNLRELEESMSYIFQGVFIHRYRDIRPEIRSLCITEIGCWMKDYSTLFLSHKYLKYVVWTLHDKVGDVRLSALHSLLKLYEIEEFLPQLEPLTSRFKGRIIGMTLDKQNEVTVEAIKLVTLLFRYGELDEEDCRQVEQLVFCSHPEIAHAAGQFLNDRLLVEAESNSPSKKRGKKSEFQKSCEYMKRLLVFFISTQIHNHGNYIVDGLWKHCEILRNWKVMTSMLLEDACNEDLSDEEETALIDIMSCCCHQAATGQAPPGRVTKKSLSPKEKRAIIYEKQEMSAHFMEKLPALLEKYGTDLPKAENLVGIPQHFDLEEYTQRRLGKQFEFLLYQIDDLVQKGAEMSLLEECAKTYATLTNNELTISSNAEVTRNKLIDDIVEPFQKACADLKANENYDDEDTYTLRITLKRITAFYKSHDLAAWDLYEDLLWICRHESLPDEIVSLALTSFQMLLLWSLCALDINHPNKRDMKILKQRLTIYIDTCLALLYFGSMESRKHAFLSLSDTLVIFAKQLTNKYPLLAPVVYQPAIELQGECENFLALYVFADVNETEANEDEDNTEIEVEELNAKRKVLAGFCKLIIFGIFPMKCARHVFSKIVSGFGNFGDIIKHTMAKCKDISKKEFTKQIALTLTQEYVAIRQNDAALKRTSESFVALKELAKRLSACFGIDSSKPYVRTSMITLHREGILLAFRKSGENADSDNAGSNNAGSDNAGSDTGTYPNMLFLDVMSDCLTRLIPQDRKAVLKYLQDQASKAKIDLNNLGRDLSSLSSYYKALTEEGQGAGGKTPKSRPLGQKAKRKLAVEEGQETQQKKRATKLDEVQDEEDDKEEDRGEEHREDDDGEDHEEIEERDETGGQENEKEGEKEDASPNSSAPATPENTERSRKKSTKRKRDEEEDNAEKNVEEDSEDEFQESGRSKPSSQVSWISSQPKRSMKRTDITYGKSSSRTKKGAVRGKKDTIIEEEEIKEEDNQSSSPKSSPSQPKKKRKEFPENIFEESTAPGTSSDEDLAPGF